MNNRCQAERRSIQGNNELLPRFSGLGPRVIPAQSKHARLSSRIPSCTACNSTGLRLRGFRDSISKRVFEMKVHRVFEIRGIYVSAGLSHAPDDGVPQETQLRLAEHAQKDHDRVGESNTLSDEADRQSKCFPRSQGSECDDRFNISPAHRAPALSFVCVVIGTDHRNCGRRVHEKSRRRSVRKLCIIYRQKTQTIVQMHATERETRRSEWRVSEQLIECAGTDGYSTSGAA